MTAATTPCWEHFDHKADIGVRGHGATPADAFVQAAVAMTAVVADPDAIEPSETVAVECRAADLEYLLVEWLDAVVFEMATRAMLFARFDVAIESGPGEYRLHGRMHGERVDRARHQPAVEVKGATLTELAVAERDGVWTAQCVVDV
jgi:SHS2 domain-containing protein